MLGRICPGCRQIYTGTSCPTGCRPGGKRTTPRRALNRKVWTSSAHRVQRLRVFARDGWRCVDCGHHDPDGRSLAADHVLGIDEHREFADGELATRCFPCSGRKDQARR